jgi:hypothetical protein
MDGPLKASPIARFAKTVKSHFVGVIRYSTPRLTSGTMEGPRQPHPVDQAQGKGL